MSLTKKLCNLISGFVVFCSPIAFAAPVAFDPPAATISNDPARGSTSTELAITLPLPEDAFINAFNTFTLLIGSSDLQITNLVLDQGFRTALQGGLLAVDVPGPGVYHSDVFTQGFLFDNEIELPVLVGTITVDAAGVADGIYTVVVDGDSMVDGGRSQLMNANLESESLVGVATITVTGSSDPGGGGTGGDDGDPVEPPPDSPDTDGDGMPDETDPDDDNDGVLDANDAFPLDALETTDSDNDGVGDNSDAFPTDGMETVDTDNDGTGDNADPDDDNDGVDDTADAFPLDPAEQTDDDGNGIGDNADAAALDSNTGPRVSGGVCGMGMLGGFLFTLMGLWSFSIVDLRYRSR